GGEGGDARSAGRGCCAHGADLQRADGAGAAAETGRQDVVEGQGLAGVDRDGGRLRRPFVGGEGELVLLCLRGGVGDADVGLEVGVDAAGVGDGGDDQGVGRRGVLRAGRDRLHEVDVYGRGARGGVGARGAEEDGDGRGAGADGEAARIRGDGEREGVAGGGAARWVDGDPRLVRGGGEGLA